MIERYSRPEMAAVWSQENKFKKWLDVEVAVCEAWASSGAIPKEAAEKIRSNASFDLERMAQYLVETHHDMTAFLHTVADSLGEESRYVHLGLTSSDVMDTALALQMREAARILEADIAKLTQVIERQALKHKDTLMIGRTHGVHAEPITFGLKLALWVDEMRRNAERLRQAKEVIAVGKISGAVGTHATVPPAVEAAACAALGLRAAPVSSQIISRDHHAQFVATLALIAASLEKFALEIRGLQRTEVREVEEPFERGQTGSSAMPHKRNPELCERICGLSRVLRGHVVTALENVALWHERDISHSSTERIILPDSCLALDYMLGIFTYVMDGLQVYPERMMANVEMTKGLIFSQRVMLALIDKGMSRQEAYKLVQDHCMRSWREGTPFLDLLEADLEVTSQLSSEELRGLFDYGHYVRHVDETFARLGLTQKG